MKEPNHTKNFQEIIESSDIPVMADFYATWCGPCMAMMPAVEEAKKRLEGKCLVIKLEVDKHLDLVSKYKVMGVPTIALFVGGEMLDSKPGPLSLEQLMRMVEEKLK